MENIRSFDCTSNPAMNVVMANFSSGTSIFRDSALNLCTYDFSLSCEPYLTVNRWQLGFLYVLAPMKWETNAIDSSLNDEMDEGGILLNQAKASPFSVVAKALHRTGS